MVERAGVRLLAAQLRSYASRAGGVFETKEMASAESRALARKVGARAMVLLKNDPVEDAPVLPLDPAKIGSIAVIGRLATRANMGDLGSSNVRPPSFVTPLDGIKAAFPGAAITLVEEDSVEKAAKDAGQAEVAIIVAGFTERDEGEFVRADFMSQPDLIALYPPAPGGRAQAMAGAAAAESSSEGNAVMTAGDQYGGDRASLTLRPVDEEIIRAVAAANPRTVVAIVAAGAVLTEAWRQSVPAVLMMWYAGMEGGHALADVLTGKQNPSGRLPFSIPTTTEHLPYFDRHANAITYDRFHGQRLLGKLGAAPAFPYGYGLSYPTYTIGEVAVMNVTPQGAQVSAVVTNTGTRDGRHTVQVYGRRVSGDHAGELWLVGFDGVDIPAGARAQVEVEVSFTPLGLYDTSEKKRVLPEVGDVVLVVGAFANDPDAVTVNL
jgi:beta-glucosidase